MMKTTLIISAGLLLASSAFLSHASSNDTPYVTPALEAKLVKVCEAIMSDKRLKLHMTLKEYRFDTRQINQGLKCNGEDPYNFAMTHEAYSNANYLNRSRVEIQDIASRSDAISVVVGK